MNQKIKIIEKFAKENLDELDWLHTKEVRIIAEKLADLEKADKKVVDTAALLHDVSKSKVSLLKHAEKSAEMAEKLLRKLKFNENFIEQVVECIAVHSSPWVKSGSMPKTIEAKVLFDADMLQQLSPLGIVKHILKYKDKPYKEIIKNSRRDLIEFAFKLLMTKNGKKIGREKVKYVREFFKSLE
jgi:uncharacterized protein